MPIDYDNMTVEQARRVKENWARLKQKEPEFIEFTDAERAEFKAESEAKFEAKYAERQARFKRKEHASNVTCLLALAVFIGLVLILNYM